MFLLLAAPSLHAQEEREGFDAKVKSWQETLRRASAVASDTEVNDETLETLKTALRETRTQANDAVRMSQTYLKSKQDLLAALGAPPEEGKKEEPRIAKLRGTLNAEIAQIDAQAKQAALIATEAQDRLNTLSEIRTTELKQRVLEKDPMLLSPALWHEAVQETERRLPDVLDGMLFALALALIIAVTHYALFFVARLNAWINTQNQYLRIIMKRSVLTQIVVAAGILFAMRYNALGLAPHNALPVALTGSAAIWLAVNLYRQLGMLQFSAHETARSEDSESPSVPGFRFWTSTLRLMRLALVAAIFAALAGYVGMAAYVSLNLAMTVLSLGLFVITRRGVDAVARQLRQEPSVAAFSARGIVLVEPLLALLFALGALYFWGLTPGLVNDWLGRYAEGIPIGNATVNPGDILSAIAVLVAFIMVTRALQWFVSERVLPHTALDSGVRNAILAIMGYTGHIVALLAALGTLGINTESLAIVAGALSVGIGFGLQAIFNNFVSGLILLLERPIKIGDWIVVGQFEGYVRNIRVRSTEIETFQNASVIVPNSQLITDTVTNWTLNNPVGRTEVRVSVAYGSDVVLVKRLLEQAADEHPQVRRRPESRAHFMDFGDNGLVFELRCFLRDVDTKVPVTSDLRFKIVELFAQHRIEIPFPQRDIHIKEPPPRRELSDA